MPAVDVRSSKTRDPLRRSAPTADPLSDPMGDALGDSLSGPSITEPIQMYKTGASIKEAVDAPPWAGDLPDTARVSDEGNAAFLGEQNLYASSDLIAGSNTKLDSAGAGVKLEEGAVGPVPGLKAVVPVAADGDSGTMVRGMQPATEEAYATDTAKMTDPLTKTAKAVKKSKGTIWNSKLTYRQLYELGANQLAFGAIMDEVTTSDWAKFTGKKGVKLSDTAIDNAVRTLSESATEIMAIRGDDKTGVLVLHKECVEIAHDIMAIGTGSRKEAVITAPESSESDTMVETPVDTIDGTSEGDVQGLAQAIYRAVERAYGVTIDTLSKTDTSLLEKQAGFNSGASPEVGESYVTTPDRWREDFEAGESTWSYHWAGVIMKDGGDDVTLENVRATGVGMSRDWYYGMYGTEKEGQSFHEEQMAGGWFGNKGTTMVVRPEKPKAPSSSSDSTTTTDD